MKLLQPLDSIGIYLASSLSQQHIGEQSATHSNFAVDTPDRKLDAFLLECFLPCQYVLVDAIDKGAVEIKKKGGLGVFHGRLLSRCKHRPTRLGSDVRA